MSGFVLIKGKLDNNIVNYQSSKYLVENLEHNDLFIQRRTIKKFLDDKVFKQNDEYLIVIEGVIFNKLELIEKYEKDNFFETIIEMYKKNGETFFNEFRGSFSGIFVDKKNSKQLIYTDHIGSKLVFYYKNEGNIVVASDLNLLIKILKQNNLNYNLDLVGVYSILTFGFMMDDFTLISEVKKVFSGEYISIIDNEFKRNKYHKFERNELKNYNEKEIIGKLDELFKKATKYQVDKNKEYGYLNLAPLSAGYDTRMMNIQLREVGEKEIYNITYSETDNNDEKIPKKLARYWKNHFLFKALDNGLSLFNIDEIVKRNMGVVYYAGGGQVYDSFSLLNFEKFGIVHTGMLGDGYPEYSGNYQVGNFISSKKLINKLEKYIDNKIFDEDSESFLTYNRGFNGMNMGQPLLLQEYTETYTPFQNVEWLEYYLSIPQNKRRNRYIQFEWLKKLYPKEAQYPINGRKINERKIKILNKEKTVKEILQYVLKKLKLSSERKGMNPLEYWYKNNLDLKLYFENYYKENIVRIKNNLELKEDIELLYKGNMLEKIQVLSLLAAIKLYFDEV